MNNRVRATTDDLEVRVNVSPSYSQNLFALWYLYLAQLFEAFQIAFHYSTDVGFKRHVALNAMMFRQGFLFPLAFVVFFMMLHACCLSWHVDHLQQKIDCDDDKCV